MCWKGVASDFRAALSQVRGVFGWVDTPSPNLLGIFYLYLVFGLLLLGIFIYLRNRKLETIITQKVLNMSAVQTFVTFGFFLALCIYIQATYTRVALLGRYFFIGALPASLVIFYALNKIYPTNKFPSAKIAFLLSVGYYLAFIFLSILPRYYV